MTLSTKSMWPSWAKSCSSISLSATDDAAARGSATSLPLLGEALVAQIRRLIEGELEADRIDRHDGGEQRGVAAGAAGDEIAGRDAAVADAAGDRRAQLGEFEIELGLPHRRLVARRPRPRATRLAWVRWSKVCSVMVLSRTSCCAAREIGFGKGEIGLAPAPDWRAPASSAFWNGRLSMVNSRSPCLTIWPSLKWIWSR